MILGFNEWHKNINEDVKFDLQSDDYIGKEEQENITNGYIDQIERATGSKVKEVGGTVSESDCDLWFYLEDDIEIRVNYKYHPNGGLMKVMVGDQGNEVERSYGKANKWGNEYETGKNPEYEGLNTGEDVYKMVKDMYRELGLGEINYTHEINLPRELFGNDPYFSYDSDEKTDQIYVSFESEEAAKSWIESLKIQIIQK